MLRRPDVLALLTLLILAGIAAAVTVHLSFFHLPDPETADRDGLLRWLVLKDLNAEEEETRLALVDRLEDELHAGLGQEDLSSASLSEAQEERLHKNTGLLKRIWFRSRVRRYSEREPDEKKPYLDRQILTVFKWSEMNGAASEDPHDSVTGLFDQIAGWIGEAEGDDRRQMLEAVYAGVARWLATRDLTDQSGHVRHELARRIAAELNTGLKVDGLLARQSESEQNRLRANGELLMEVWFHQCADEYLALDVKEQDGYVDRLIDNVLNWGVVDFLADNRNGKNTTEADQTAGLLHVMRLVETWIERAEPQRQAHLRQFVQHIQRWALLRQWQKPS